MRVPRGVLEELEAVRRYTRTDAPDIATTRYVAIETGKPALAVWLHGHESEYGRGVLDGFEAEH